MTSREIRQIKEDCYKQIKECNDRLNEIREMCFHENKSIGIYSPRDDQYFNAEICEDCGKAIRFIL